MRARSGGMTAMALGLLLAAAPAAAQAVVGRVVDHDTGSPLAGARVVLTAHDDSPGAPRTAALADSAGRFHLAVPYAGSWVVRAEVLGYTTSVSEPFVVTPEERVELEIRMAVRPIPVEPVAVVSRTSHVSADIRAFYARVQAGRRTGVGDFLTRAEIERAAGTKPSDLVRRLPGVRVTKPNGHAGTRTVVRFSRGCVPALYVDGSRINQYRIEDSLDEFVVSSNIEGIEVYRGVGHRVDGFYDDRGCGMILVWTRHGTRDGPDFTWGRFLVGASLVLGVLLLR
ncbi:MAG: carboxypeptidase regulatory-like domain-containing protein [Longimicrobiales bacterium]